MRKLNKSEKLNFRKVINEQDLLVINYQRRFNNALRSLRNNRSDWREILSGKIIKGMTIKKMAKVVEFEAAEIVLQSYAYVQVKNRGQFIFSDDGTMISLWRDE
jgi:hypothetical protein